MFRNLLLTIGLILVANLVVFSQSGTLKGKIIDKTTKEPVPFANIVVELSGAQKGGATSDFDGNYMIKPIPPGTYDLKATYIGYNTVLVRGMVINADQIRFYDIEMEPTAEQLPEIIVSDFAIPLINKDETVSGGQITEEEIKKMPNRSVDGVATTVGGVFSEDGERGNVRGARSDQTVMFIDGIRVLGSATLPQSSIEQVAVYLGGLPAQYGDARGGIINVTTKGPSGKFGAGLELEQSVDAYGHSRVGLNLQGPIIKSKKESETSILGYFISGDGYFNKDQRPTAQGVYLANDETMQYLEQSPLVPTGLSAGGTYSTGEFVRRENLELKKSNPNSSRYGANISGKLDLRPSNTTNFTLGGQYNLDNGRAYSFANTMFNSDKNYLYKDESWRVFGRFTQRFPTSNESNSLVKNVYYSLQFDYSQQNTRSMDPDHKDDIFKYGYLGKFTTYKIPTDTIVSKMVINNVTYENVFVLNSWDFDTAYVFQPASYNPIVAKYTEQIYDLFPVNWEQGVGNGIGNWSNADQLQLRGGLLNGETPDAFYGIWGAPGTVQTAFGESHNNQISVNAAASADIGNHEIKFGFIYDQRIERGFSYAATGLWTKMRGLANFHIKELDIDHPQTEYLATNNYVYYYRKYDSISQYTFDRNLRNKLGLEEKGLDFILVDSYSFDDNSIQYYDKDGILHTKQLDGDLYSIDMFSADELLNDGKYIAYAYGYDYYGNKLTTKPSIEDFFTAYSDINSNGKKDYWEPYTRPIPAYEPIYMAGYIQDKFAFNDLIFNVGVRVDRFDANQPVLKDPFLMYPAKSVGETTNLGGNLVTHPGNMGSDYVVYVDNVTAPTEITGYRNEYTWYNADGVEIQDPFALDRGSGVSPLLQDPSQSTVNSKAFKDYEPQVNVMPRISFSFPISDEALFFAHYDVLTQRPLGNQRFDPSAYYFINNIGGNIDNPSLKPTKTIDYELGFQQKLSMKSSLKLTAFYREMRDDIQIYRFNGAYPRDYTSFSNLDFGTVKGLTVTYDLRRLSSNTRLNASYTLQFAEGTGSSTTTAAALVASGLPNLRTTNPLDWDRRHNFNISLDYRYGEGKDYNGPVITRRKGTDTEKAVQFLSNTGVNFTVTGGSGTPYTAQENILAFNSGGTRVLKGTINGSRLPWQFRVDMRLDKEFYVGMGQGKNKAYFDVYLQVLNLFDTENVLAVYAATGVPDDDGYLAAAEWQREINSQADPQSYRDLYSIRINSPGNLSSPRQIRLGLQFNF
jgi:hypothetical protein